MAHQDADGEGIKVLQGFGRICVPEVVGAEMAYLFS